MLIRFLFVITLLSPGVTHADDLDALNTLIQTYTATVSSLDMTTIESIWSTEENVSFIHPRGHETGWPAIRQAFYLDTMGRLSKRTLEAERINVRLLSPTTAWGDFYWHFKATFKDGTNIETRGRETQVWEKIDGSWKIVHVHYSGLPVSGEREGF